MNRRKSIQTLAAGLALPAAVRTAAAAGAGPIQLHCDLDVDPAKEKQMLAAYQKVFRPTISKQPGFVEVKLLKLREAKAGKAPANAPYRLIISFKTEEERTTWVATADHQKAWPPVENCLRGAKYVAILYDAAV